MTNFERISYMFRAFSDSDMPLIINPDRIFGDTIIGFTKLASFPMQVVGAGSKWIYTEPRVSTPEKPFLPADEHRDHWRPKVDAEYVHFRPYPMLDSADILTTPYGMNPFGKGAVWTLLRVDQWLNDFTNSLSGHSGLPNSASAVYFYPELLNCDILPDRKWEIPNDVQNELRKRKGGSDE